MSTLVCDELDTALAAVISAAGAGALAAVVPGKNATNKTLPIVICVSEGDGEDDPKGSGNFWLSAQVIVKSSAVDGDAPLASDQALVELVFMALLTADLPEKLTAAARSLTVFPQGVFFGAQESGRDESGHWMDTLPLRVYCCGGRLS